MLVKNYQKIDVERSWREGWGLLRQAQDELDCHWHAEELFAWVVHQSSDLGGVRHFGDIIRNARLFYEKYGEDFDKLKGQPSYELGYVYLLHADNHNFKIGKSKQVDKRVEQIGLIVPNKIKLVQTILTDAMTYHERFLHLLFRDSHVCGEWFKLDFWQFLFLLSQDEVRYFRPDTYDSLDACIGEIGRDYEFETLNMHQVRQTAKRWPYA